MSSVNGKLLLDLFANAHGTLLKTRAPCGNPALDGRDREPVAGAVIDREVGEFFLNEPCEHFKVSRLDSERGDDSRTRLATGNHASDRLPNRLAVAGAEGIRRAKGAERSAVLLDGAPISGLEELDRECDAALLVNPEHGVNPALRALSEIDYLCAVDDVSRMGALTVLDEDGTLALGKFPSVQDERSVTRGEVLALRLGKLAGIETADARIVMVEDAPVAIIRRFDRTRTHGRIPYMSGATLLQSSRHQEHAYTGVVDAMRSKSIDFSASAQQLWRRLVFNFLITNVDDHLQNTGFLYVQKNQWRLSPAFDVNPFPDEDRERPLHG